MQKLDDAEDGEISDEAEDYILEPYQSLERPASSAPSFKAPPSRQVLDDSDESTESSSSSESSSDERSIGPAKKRRKADAKPSRPSVPATKKNPWSSVIFEDSLNSTFKDVNVRHGNLLLDKSREVESYYNYGRAFGDRLGGEDVEEEAKIRNTLAALDKKDGGDSFAPIEEEAPCDTDDFEKSLKETQNLLKTRKRKMDQRDPEPARNKKPARKSNKMSRVEDLSTTVSSKPLDLAQDIALKLSEDKIDLILRSVEILGNEVAIQLFKETQDVENEGGIPVADGSRRRTPGGVFFYLLRNHDEIPMEKIRLVFSEETKAKEKHKRVLRAKRRQEQAKKLSSSVQGLVDLPPLPTRFEVEMQSKLAGEQKGEQIQETSDGTCPETEATEANYDDIVDINFDLD